MRTVRLVRMYSRISYELVRNILRLNKLCESDTRIDGRVVIVTGANTGIGKETAYQLSLRGAKVIMACRNTIKADYAKRDICLRNDKADLVVMKLDLSSLDSVRDFVHQIDETERKVDILINNAGIMMCPEWQTADGYEMQFGTNYLGHFLLTMLLLPKIQNSTNGRIINISSVLHMAGKIYFEDFNFKNKKYSPVKAYCQSKLAIVMFTKELAKRLGPHSTIKVYSLHPGLVRTDLFRNFSPIYKFFNNISKRFYTRPRVGSQTTLFCALSEELENEESGAYFEDCVRNTNMIRKVCDQKSSRRLWELSCDLVGLPSDLRLEEESNYFEQSIG